MKKETVTLLRKAMRLKVDLKEYIDNKTPISLKSLINTLFSEYSNSLYIIDGAHGEKITINEYKEPTTNSNLIYERHCEKKVCIVADVVEDDRELVGGNDIEIRPLNKNRCEDVDLINDIVIITKVYYQGD